MEKIPPDPAFTSGGWLVLPRACRFGAALGTAGFGGVAGFARFGSVLGTEGFALLRRGALVLVFGKNWPLLKKSIP